MRIGYCTITDPHNRRSWSGIHYFMMKAMEKHCGEVIPFGPLNNRLIFLGKIINKVTNLLLNKDFDYIHSPFITKEFARILKKKISKHKCDILFSPVGSQLLADLDTDLPIVYFSDTTFTLMLGYYASFSNLAGISKKWGIEADRRAIGKADILLYSSKWAAESAIADYGAGRDRTHFIPMGANLEAIPSRDDIMSHRKKAHDILKILFVGVDWKRKGGDIVFQTMAELNRRGVDTELIVCGCIPPPEIKHERLRVVGFLDKNDPGQASKLQNIYMDSSLFFMPTRNETAGIVFCESAAYGLPAISTLTGGVSTYVEDGINGYLLPVESDFKDYADLIQKIWEDETKYIALCESSRSKHESELNWDSWGKRVAILMGNLVSKY